MRDPGDIGELHDPIVKRMATRAAESRPASREAQLEYMEQWLREQRYEGHELTDESVKAALEWHEELLDADDAMVLQSAAAVEQIAAQRTELDVRAVAADAVMRELAQRELKRRGLVGRVPRGVVAIDGQAQLYAMLWALGFKPVSA